MAKRILSISLAAALAAPEILAPLAAFAQEPQGLFVIEETVKKDAEGTAVVEEKTMFSLTGENPATTVIPSLKVNDAALDKIDGQEFMAKFDEGLRLLTGEDGQAAVLCAADGPGKKVAAIATGKNAHERSYQNVLRRMVTDEKKFADFMRGVGTKITCGRKPALPVVRAALKPFKVRPHAKQ